MKEEPSQVIPQKSTANLELLQLKILLFKNKCGGCQQLARHFQVFRTVKC